MADHNPGHYRAHTATVTSLRFYLCVCVSLGEGDVNGVEDIAGGGAQRTLVLIFSL